MASPNAQIRNDGGSLEKAELMKEIQKTGQFASEEE